jgi:hypothetical protein
MSINDNSSVKNTQNMQKTFEVRNHLATSTKIAPSTSPWCRHALVCPCSWALSSSKDIPTVYFVLPGKLDQVISWYSQPNQLICQFCGNINWTIVVNLLTLTDHKNKKTQSWSHASFRCNHMTVQIFKRATQIDNVFTEHVYRYQDKLWQSGTWEWKCDLSTVYK